MINLYTCFCRRQNPEHQGGFLLDGGIHFVAALRFLLSAASSSITQVAAFTSLMQPNLSPLDTANATMYINNGNSGTFSISYGTEFGNAFQIQVIMDRGAVSITPTLVTVLTRDDKGCEKIYRQEFSVDSGVRREMAVFAKGIKEGKVEVRGTVEEALMDLRVVQGILESGREGGRLKSVV